MEIVRSFDNDGLGPEYNFQPVKTFEMKYTGS